MSRDRIPQLSKTRIVIQIVKLNIFLPCLEETCPGLYSKISFRYEVKFQFFTWFKLLLFYLFHVWMHGPPTHWSFLFFTILAISFLYFLFFSVSVESLICLLFPIYNVKKKNRTGSKRLMVFIITLEFSQTALANRHFYDHLGFQYFCFLHK